MRRIVLRECIALFAAIAELTAQQRGRGAAPPRSDAGPYGALAYRYLGPPGNRAIAVAGVSGAPQVYYVGAASGGIWKTVDGGVHWQPIFDEQRVSSIGALAVAPSDSNVVWAGTGESFIRSHISLGWGMFRSNDAGRTWRRAGLEQTGRIARIAVDPRNPAVVLVAALGHAYAPQPERGIFRTTDGGHTWSRVLFVNDSTGGIDVLRDPVNADVVYAATWQIDIHTWGRTSGGAGSGIWKSVDGGATWRRLSGNGLPIHALGKIGLGVTRANPNRVYALIETGKGMPFHGEPTDVGSLWRSDDAGATWRLVNSNNGLLARPAYYTRMAVAPDNADEAYFLAIGFSGTRDGGLTMSPRTTLESPGFDNHDMWIDPADGNRMAVANDEGVSISNNRGRTWARIRLPIAQIYHVTTDNRVPYTVCGNMQDGPSTCGPSQTKNGDNPGITGGAAIPRGAWYSVGGGESGWATPDPVNPNIVWSTASGRGSAGGIVVRYDVDAKMGRDVEVWPVSTAGHPAKDVRFRFVWDFPITISPHDHNTIYVGSQFVHKTTNGGQSWELISPDLTLNDKSKQQWSGGLTGDNIGVEYGDVIYAIAESPVEPGLIWVGTNDGVVQLTRNGGKQWTNVSRNIPTLLPWSTISSIEPSRHHAGTAYLTVNGHQEGNFEPWVYRTRDYGRTWTLIVHGIERGPLGFARCIREDPTRAGLLYLGTENALYVSFDDGDDWEPLQLNLPHAPVSWLTVQRTFSDLVVATYGRGFYVLDDITPLEQLTPQVRQSTAYLFAPRSAYRFRLSDTNVREASDDPTAGANPPYGAAINYWLSGGAGTDVTLTVADSVGKTIRTIAGPKVAGINRVMWDLRFDPASSLGAPVAAPPGPTPPTGAEEGPPAGGGRVGRGNASLMILAPPGRYTITLLAGATRQSRSLTVLKDPSSGGSAADIAAQTSMLVDLASDLRASSSLYADIDAVRGQLRALRGRLSADRANADLTGGADSLEHRFMLLADSLAQQNPGAFYEWPQKLTAKISYLASEVQVSDNRPTDQAREARAFLEGQLALVRREYAALVAKDLAAFNAQLRRRGLQGVITTVP